jgi:hypothetical protein
LDEFACLYFGMIPLFLDESACLYFWNESASPLMMAIVFWRLVLRVQKGPKSLVLQHFPTHIAGACPTYPEWKVLFFFIFP